MAHIGCVLSLNLLQIQLIFVAIILFLRENKFFLLMVLPEIGSEFHERNLSMTWMGCLHLFVSKQIIDLVDK